jgi:hypothetical protein
MDDPIFAAAPRPRAVEPWPRADWHGARLAAFLQDGGRVGSVVCPSSDGRAALLDAALRLTPWPVMRAGNPLASPLTLYRLLIQVGAEDDGGDEGDSLLRCLKAHASGPDPVILLVDDAHSLAGDVLLALARVPGLAGPDRPGVALILAGGSALPGMLLGPGLESLRDPATTMTWVLSGSGRDRDAAVPVAAPAATPGDNPVPLPPARAEQVFHAPIDRGIVQIPMPLQRPALVVDAPAAGTIVQIPMPDAPGVAVPPPVPDAPMWARPSAKAPTGHDDAGRQRRPYLGRSTVNETPAAMPRIEAPGGAPVLASELVSPRSVIDEHIMGVRSQITDARPAPAHRVWLAVAAVIVAAAAAGGALLALQFGQRAGLAPAVVMAPAVVIAPALPEATTPVVRVPPRQAPLATPPRQPDLARRPAPSEGQGLH